MSWEIWLLIAILFLVVEIFSGSFFFISLSAGAIGGSIGSFLGELELQLFISSLFLLLSFLLARPFLLKISNRSQKTNTDALIGQKGRVLIEINSVTGTGRVIVGGDDWKAISIGDILIPEGTIVEVIKVDSTIIYVK